MTIYATGNPVGSTSPKDLIDNAQNLDYLILGPALSYPDRRGVNRLSWAGIEASFAAAQAQREAEHDADQVRREAEFDADQTRRESEFDSDQARRESEFDVAQYDRQVRFETFIADSGYDVIGDYASQPVTFTERNQLMLKAGELWKPKASVTLPYSTTGVWASESVNFVSVGDAALRQELGSSSGAEMSGWQRTALAQEVTRVGHMLNASRVNAWEFAHLAPGYSVGGNPSTWDWAPAINAAIAYVASIGGGVLELPSIDLPLKTKSTLAAPFSDPTISGYGISIPSGVSVEGRKGTRLIQGYLGASLDDRHALVTFAGTSSGALHRVDIVGSLSAVGRTYGVQMINASNCRLSSIKVQDTMFTGLSMACLEGALVSGLGCSFNTFMDLEFVNIAIDHITMINGAGVNDAVPTRAPMEHNTFYSVVIRDARPGAGNAIAFGIRRAHHTKVYGLRMLNMPEGGVVIESGASYTEIYGIDSTNVGTTSGAAAVLHYHVSDWNTAGGYAPGIGNKIFGGHIRGGGRAFLHKGDYDTLHHGITVDGSTYRCVGTDNVDTAAGNVANPAINPMRITYSSCTFDGLYNVSTALGNTEPGLSFSLGSGHKVVGGRISKFKVGISDNGEANDYSSIAFTLNERDVSSPTTLGKAIVRNCGPTLNSTLVQQNVALAGLIRPTDAGYGAFNSGANAMGSDPTSIGNEDAVVQVTLATRTFSTIPAFAYVGYPGTNVIVRIRAKALTGACSVQTVLVANGATVSTQTAQTVPVGSWSWYSFSIPIASLVDVANCAINTRSASTMGGTLLVDAIKIDIV